MSGENITSKKRRRRLCDYEVKKFSDLYQSTDEYLGEGACGYVRTFYSVTNKKEFAVKIVSKTNGHVRMKILREIEILHHCRGQDNIIQLHEYFEEDDRFYLVFEKMKGGTLLEWIDRHGPLSEIDASKVVKGIAEALHFLHDKGVAHRDLKLENILCSSYSNMHPVKVCDFDLSSEIKPDLTIPMQSFEQFVSAVGSADFMAPEVISVWLYQAQSYTQQCDMWSLGVIMYILLSAFKPFFHEKGPNCICYQSQQNLLCDACRMDLFEVIQKGKFEFYDSEWAFVSKEAQALIQSLLVLDPLERYTPLDVLNHPWIRREGTSKMSNSRSIPCMIYNNSNSMLSSYNHFNTAKICIGNINNSICNNNYNPMDNINCSNLDRLASYSNQSNINGYPSKCHNSDIDEDEEHYNQFSSEDLSVDNKYFSKNSIANDNFSNNSNANFQLASHSDQAFSLNSGIRKKLELDYDSQEYFDENNEKEQILPKLDSSEELNTSADDFNREKLSESIAKFLYIDEKEKNISDEVLIKSKNDFKKVLPTLMRRNFTNIMENKRVKIFPMVLSKSEEIFPTYMRRFSKNIILNQTFPINLMINKDSIEQNENVLEGLYPNLPFEEYEKNKDNQEKNEVGIADSGIVNRNDIFSTFNAENPRDFFAIKECFNKEIDKFPSLNNMDHVTKDNSRFHVRNYSQQSDGLLFAFDLEENNLVVDSLGKSVPAGFVQYLSFENNLPYFYGPCPYNYASNFGQFNYGMYNYDMYNYNNSGFNYPSYINNDSVNWNPNNIHYLDNGYASHNSGIMYANNYLPYWLNNTCFNNYGNESLNGGDYQNYDYYNHINDSEVNHMRNNLSSISLNIINFSSIIQINNNIAMNITNDKNTLEFGQSNQSGGKVSLSEEIVDKVNYQNNRTLLEGPIDKGLLDIKEDNLREQVVYNNSSNRFKSKHNNQKDNVQLHQHSSKKKQNFYGKYLKSPKKIDNNFGSSRDSNFVSYNGNRSKKNKNKYFKDGSNNFNNDSNNYSFVNGRNEYYANRIDGGVQDNSQYSNNAYQPINYSYNGPSKLGSLIGSCDSGHVSLFSPFGSPLGN